MLRGLSTLTSGVSRPSPSCTPYRAALTTRRKKGEVAHCIGLSAVSSSVCINTYQRRAIHSHRTIFNMYQELASWDAEWPIRPPIPRPANEDPRQCMHYHKRHHSTSPDHWSPLMISEFISQTVTQQSATDCYGRTVHPSSFVEDLPWTFFSGSRLVTVPRLKQFANRGRHDGYESVLRERGVGGGIGMGRDAAPSSSSSTAISSIAHGPMSLLFHGSPCAIDILKRGARFVHNSNDAQGIYLTPSLGCARGYAGIHRVEISTCKTKKNPRWVPPMSPSSAGAAGAVGAPQTLTPQEASLVTKLSPSIQASDLPMPASYEEDWWNSVATVSDAALRQRGVLVCLVALGKVYHRYAEPDPSAEKLIADGKWAIEGQLFKAPCGETTAAEKLSGSNDGSVSSSAHSSFHRFSMDQFGFSSSRGGGGYSQSLPALSRSGHHHLRRSTPDPNNDPARPYDSYVDFVDGEQVYCVRNPDNIIPIVALGINRQSLAFE